MRVEQAVQRAEAIVRFTEEVDRRLAEHGIAGIEDLFRLYTQLRDALDRIAARELDWASTEAGRLSKVLEQICAQLSHLSALKTSLEMRH